MRGRDAHRRCLRADHPRSMRPPKVRVYALTVQVRAPGSGSDRSWMCGAIATTVTSRISISWATKNPKIFQREKCAAPPDGIGYLLASHGTTFHLVTYFDVRSEPYPKSDIPVRVKMGAS